MQFISMKCPDCGAKLEVEEGRKEFFCSYCGAKVIINNENEHIYRHIDEAEVKQAETERLIQLKKLEIEENKRIADEKMKSFKIKISIVLAIVAIGALIIGFAVEGAIRFTFVGYFALLAIMFMWMKNDGQKGDETENKK